MYRVILVDDEQVILNGLKRVISWAEYGCEVVGTATDGVGGIELARKVKPHIVLSDIRMPNMDGLAMIAALKSEHPEIQVAILTAFRDFEYARQAIRLGVARYLLKPSRMEELMEAIVYMVGVLGDSALPRQTEARKDTAGEETEASMFVVNAALSYIEGHYREQLRLSDVADSVYVSQWHLSKLINKHLGKSFFDILSGLRVEAAKRLLPDPALKVHEIAALVGFSDVAHFSKTFKRLVGRSPGEYRGRG